MQDHDDSEEARIAAGMARGSAGMELTEREAYGHLQHALGNAIDAARASFRNMGAALAFTNALKSAHAAMRSLGILRSEERWVVAARPLQDLIDMVMLPGRPVSGDMRWLAIAGKLDGVRTVVDRMYEQGRTGAVQSLLVAH